MKDEDYLRIAEKIERFVSGAFDEEVKSIITKRAVIAGFCMAIPLWGAETIIYAFVLWKTYSKISDISGVPFREHFFRNVFGGMLVNVLVTFGLACAMDFIPVVGWIASFVLGFASLNISAMGYVKMLKVLHGKKPN